MRRRLQPVERPHELACGLPGPELSLTMVLHQRKAAGRRDPSRGPHYLWFSAWCPGGGKGNRQPHWPGQAAAAAALPTVPGFLGRCLVEAVPRGWKRGRSWSPTSSHPNCFHTPRAQAHRRADWLLQACLLVEWGSSNLLRSVRDYPLHSCLEDSMDREPGGLQSVGPQSQTRLST